MARNHLQIRGTRFFFRRRIPLELQEALGKKEIKIALGTSDRTEANRLVTLETLKSDQLFERTRSAVQQVSPRPQARQVGYNEALVLVAEWYQKLEQESDDWLESNIEIFQNPEELRAELETCHLDELVFSGGGEWGWGRRYQGESGRQLLLSILEQNQVTFRGDDTELKRLAGVVRKGYLENARNDIKRLNRENLDASQMSWFDTRANLSTNAGVQPSGSSKEQCSVGDILDTFMQEQAAKDRSEATLRTYTVPVRILREALGEKTPLATVDRDRMKEVRSLIMELPANARKFYPDKGLLESVACAKRDGLKPIARRTADNYLRNIQAIFNFAVRTRKIPYNPVADELFRGGPRSGAEARPQFSVAELNRLFSSPEFLSGRERSRGQGRFWVPLIGLYHGTRSNEACQLYTEDIFEKDGILCIQITETRKDGSPCEKRLKTKPSRRFIPVHPMLMEIGFAEFWNRRQADSGSPRLFPDLEIGKKGYFSDPFQKWFGRLLVQTLGFKPKATFHSFRHMWKDAMTEAEVPENIAKRLGGWTSDTSAASNYGQGPKPRMLLEALRKVAYPGLDLGHLKAPAR